MSASNYLENALLNHLFGKSSFQSPTIYVALCSSSPSDTDSGGTIPEVSYGGYARVSTTSATWNSASDGQISNAQAISFPECTSGNATATHFALVDAASGGNLLVYGQLTSSLAISQGITPRFSTGALTVAMD